MSWLGEGIIQNPVLGRESICPESYLIRSLSFQDRHNEESTEPRCPAGQITSWCRVGLHRIDLLRNVPDRDANLQLFRRDSTREEDAGN